VGAEHASSAPGAVSPGGQASVRGGDVPSGRQYRHEGRYEEAADLIAEGLRVSPNIAVGHPGRVRHVVFREMPAAKTSFRRVLSLDPYHPRALFGFARIALEEGDIEGCRPFLDRAIQYFPDFPEAKALQEMVATWSAPAAAVPSTVGAVNTERLRLPQGAHDLILTHADGTLVFAQGSEERQRHLSMHMTQVYRIASATLARAGLGAMRRGVIEGSSEMTFVRSDGGVILGVALPRAFADGGGLVQVRPALDRSQHQGLSRGRLADLRFERGPRPGTTVPRPSSRAQAFRETLFELDPAGRGPGRAHRDPGRARDHLRAAPPRFPVALAALAATLGRELELGASRLERGAFRTALFSADDGTVFIGGSPVGYVTLVADRNVNMEAVRAALGRAVDRLRGTWRTAGAA
jgi:predicted regulator of Ras-like GTPase activity (Roadblock/LC7/MglB family)